jgi:hypothetical protein
MQLHEIPALPFALDIQSATDWLDRLPVGNIRECSLQLFPVMQGLNLYPMDPHLRLYILEHCHPVVFSIARGLQPHFVGKPFPLDGKTRKIASLAARIHLEAAQGYQQLVEVETEAFAKPPAGDERLLALWRALEHLAHSLLRSVQVYELPTSSIGASLAKLYRHAHASGLLDETRVEERERTASARSWFTHMALFGLAAAGRLAQEDIQRLFDRLVLQTASTEIDLGPEDRRGMAVFCYEPADIGLLVPAWPDSPPLPDLPAFSAKDFCRLLRADMKASGQPESDPFGRVLARIGERLPCSDQAGGRRVVMSVGLDATVPMLREVEARRLTKSQLSETWSGRNDLALSPLENLGNAELRPPRFVGRRSLTDIVATAETTEDKRSVEVVPTELPGFYLIDSGRWPLRAGLLIGLNSDDHSIQLGVIRAGQIRDGRFWHSLELLGDQVRLARAGKVSAAREDMRDAVLIYQPGGEIHLLVAPAKWRRDDTVTLRWWGEAEKFRLAQLVEATSDFHQYALAETGAQSG